MDDEFEGWLRDAEPRLRRAFVAVRPPHLVPDAVAEALAYAWEHWETLRAMSNPIGYAFRVGQSRTRARKPVELPPPPTIGVPEVEPGLVPALMALPEAQRTAVWLVTACGWTHTEAAEAMGISASTVSTHVRRGLASVRRRIEVVADA